MIDASSSDLDRTLTAVLGGRAGKALREGFGLVTVSDLLAHFPRRYLPRGQLTELSSLPLGEEVTICARVAKVQVRPMQRRRGSILQADLTDGTGSISVAFFNQGWRQNELRIGRMGLFAGQVNAYRGGLQLTHPRYTMLPDGVDDDPALVAQFTEGLLPVYPATAKITSWAIGESVRIVLDTLGDLQDPIPPELRARHGLVDLPSALRGIHRPADEEEVVRARTRLAFEEAFTLQVVMARRRAEALAERAVPRAIAGPVLAGFDASLPFDLTIGQRRVGQEIADDLARGHPMMRLLQGDVGSGKTVVALRAMLSVVDAGGQAVLLAPTEVLAAQHHRTIRAMLGPLGEAGMLSGAEHATRVTLLTGSQRAAERQRSLLEILTGEAGIVVGTHALLQDGVAFHDLALVVVDEQHRFGVEQRSTLADRGRDGMRPHLLVMTATPIPRTVAMTVFGDLDVSVLDDVPMGRSPIATHVVRATQRPDLLARTWQRVLEEVTAGHRVFVVCPRIGDEPPSDDDGHIDDDADAEASAGVAWGAGEPSVAGSATRARPTGVLEMAELLANTLPGVRFGVLHGRMRSEEKDEVMRGFAHVADPTGPQVLVATTVIEVGIDVPDATTMVVMDADRFGISQLHQLRGRVGRGSLPGLCLLVTSVDDGPVIERLDAVAATTDGFELSRLDLSMRREGDVLGVAQAGRRSSLRLLEVLRDEALIETARQAAVELVGDDPQLTAYPALAQACERMVHIDQAAFLDKT